MYHSEGYVDRQTYLAGGNIWNLRMEQDGNSCYFWYVLPAGMEHPVRKCDLKRILGDWFYQELPMALERGSVYIQKELNRFGEYLRGNLEWPLLYLYYNKKMYFNGKDAEEVGWNVIGGMGMCVSSEMTMAADIMHSVSEGNKARAELADVIFTGKSVESKKTARYKCMAKLGNDLKRSMLKALSEGKLELGFFLIWEDEYAV